MSRRLTFTILILGVGILAVYVGNNLYRNYNRPSQPSLPNPLENVEFPSEPTQYPADWPDELKFPEDFTLLDSTSGILPESTTTGWSAKLKYQGKPSDAVKLASAFLEEKGWTIFQKTQLDSGGFSLILEREQGGGIVIIDADPNDVSASLIIATLFPKRN